MTIRTACAGDLPHTKAVPAFVTALAEAVGQPWVRALAYAACILTGWIGWIGTFPLDDAYITLHNARALLAGADTTYGGSPLVGATSLVHLALLALLGHVLPLVTASCLLNILAPGAYAAGLDKLARNCGVAGWQVAIYTIIGLTIGSIPIQLCNGLESGMALAVATWLLALARSRFLPLLAGIAPFVRPELGLLAALLLAHPFLKASARGKVNMVAYGLLTALPFAIWSVLETGHVLPNTVSAKLAFFVEESSDPLERFRMLLGALTLSHILLLMAGLIAFKKNDLTRACSVFTIVLLLVATATQPGALVWNEYRYLMTLVPVLLVCCMALGQDLRYPVLMLGLFACAIAFLPTSLDLLQQSRAHTERELRLLRHNAALMPQDATVLIHDAGMIAWVAPRLHLIDAVGLKTAYAAAAHKRFTKTVCRWDRALDDTARHFGTRYMIVLQKPLWDCVGSNLVRAGWTATSLGGQDRNSDYRIFAIQPPLSR